MALNNEEVVPPLTTEEFISFGKVPDFVRDVKPFYGDPTKLIDWIADIDSIFRTYREKGATAAQISVLERTIRRKVEGEAANVLNANNVLTDWADIKQTLILYYRDQRDIKTLDFQLTSIKKSPNESLNSYFSRVNELLSLIIAQIQTHNVMRLNAAAHIDYFREKSIDSFIRGLDKPLSILVKSINPTSLGQAYNFCIEYHNMDIRSAPCKNEFGGHPPPKPREPPMLPPRMYATQTKTFSPPPPLPRRPPTNPFLSNPFAQKQFQQNSFRPNPFQTNPFRPNYPPKPSQFPQPMEVDPSLRTGVINYSNRPPFNLKRPFPPSQHYQPNAKRQAHPLETTYQSPECYEWYDDPPYCYDEHLADYYTDVYSCDELLQPEHETGEASGVIKPSESTASEPQAANFLEWRPLF